MDSIIVDEQKVTIIIEKRKRKTLEIQIKSGVLVRVLAPQRLAIKRIHQILEEKMDWITEKVRQKRVLETKRLSEPLESDHLNQVMIEGLLKAVVIHRQESTGKQNLPSVTLEGDRLHMTLKGTPSTEAEDLAQQRIILETFLRQLCKTKLDILVPYYARMLGVSVNRVVVKEQKRRWGSCSSLKNLNFNWRCAMMPDWVFEYIVIHEICHLVHMNHSKAFWDLVRTVDPNFEQAKVWLRKNGMALNL